MAEGIISGNTIFLSLIMGILPPVIWLIFWLREDEKHPEPKHLILMTFLGGMLCVMPTYFAQKMIINLFPIPVLVYVIWPLIEELAKFFIAYCIALKTRAFDEPIDAMIYLITAALGFASIENFLFLSNKSFSIISFLTANMRFVGATLLHLLSSATVGVFIALAFYRSLKIKRWAIILGLATATSLHSLFNYFIMRDNGDSMLNIFVILWMSIVVLILLFEKIKQVRPQ